MVFISQNDLQSIRPNERRGGEDISPGPGLDGGAGRAKPCESPHEVDVIVCHSIILS